MLGGAPTPVEVDVEEGSLEGDASLGLQEDWERMEIGRRVFSVRQRGEHG